MEKVTYSVALAIQFMLNLTRHRLTYDRERCPALKPTTWCNFVFFRRIRPLPIRRIERLSPVPDQQVGMWIVERDIEFYIQHQLIGVVTLRGQKLDRDPVSAKYLNAHGLDVEDARSFWAISHVWYYRVVDGRRLEERIETDVPFSGFSAGQV